MTFIRIKKIKGQAYAYLVENEWTPWGSRQKVVKYLGKTYKPEKAKAENKELEGDILKGAIQQELLHHGFLIWEKSLLQLGEIKVNLDKMTVKKKGKKLVLEMNEGYMCDETLQELKKFKASDNPEKTMPKLAKSILGAGLKPGSSDMLKIYESIEKK